MNKAKATSTRQGSAVARIAIRLVIGLTVLFGSIGVFRVLQENRPRPAQVTDAANARLVSVVAVRTHAIARRFNGFGTTRAVRETTLAAEVSARVTDRPEAVRAGQRVAAGATVVSLNPDVFRERANAARSGADALKADLASLDVELESTQERLRLSEQAITLLDNELSELNDALTRGAAVQIEVDRLTRQRTGLELEREALRQLLASIPSRRASTEARLAAQRAELALANIDVDRSSIRAPISGVLAAVYVDKGDSVSPGTPICRIIDLEVIEIPLQIPASAATEISSGARAVILEPSAGGRRYEGTVVRVAPEVDAASRTITVFVEVRQPALSDSVSARDSLLPGHFVAGEVFADTSRDSLAIPRLAVMSDRVMIYDPDTKSAQPRTAPIQYFTDELLSDGDGWDQWAILNPSKDAEPWQAPRLQAGDLVIVSNLDELPPGTPVRLMTESDRTAAP